MQDIMEMAKMFRVGEMFSDGRVPKEMLDQLEALESATKQFQINHDEAQASTGEARKAWKDAKFASKMAEKDSAEADKILSEAKRERRNFEHWMKPKRKELSQLDLDITSRERAVRKQMDEADRLTGEAKALMKKADGMFAEAKVRVAEADKKFAALKAVF